jgi:hypothetical protein
MGNPALYCSALGIYSSQNFIRVTMAGLLGSMGVGLLGSSLVPADVFLPNLADDSPTAVDVSVVHPQRLRKKVARAHALQPWKERASVAART